MMDVKNASARITKVLRTRVFLHDQLAPLAARPFAIR